MECTLLRWSERLRRDLAPQPGTGQFFLDPELFQGERTRVPERADRFGKAWAAALCWAAVVNPGKDCGVGNAWALRRERACACCMRRAALFSGIWDMAMAMESVEDKLAVDWLVARAMAARAGLAAS